MGELSLITKATLVLVGALLVTRLTHRIAASTRALVLTAAFGALLMLPVMELVVPARPVEVQLPRMASGPARVLPTMTGESATNPDIGSPQIRAAAGASLPLPRPAMVVRLAWAIGVLIVLIRLGIGLGRLRGLRKAGESWVDSRAAAILQQATSRRVDLFLHGGLKAPMTCGVLRPAIGLPMEARDWSAPEVRQALIHEVEHIRRGDWLVQVLVRVASGLVLVPSSGLGRRTTPAP